MNMFAKVIESGLHNVEFVDVTTEAHKVNPFYAKKGVEQVFICDYLDALWIARIRQNNGRYDDSEPYIVEVDNVFKGGNGFRSITELEAKEIVATDCMDTVYYKAVETKEEGLSFIINEGCIIDRIA